MKVIKMQRNSTDCLICGMDNPLGLKALFYHLEDGSVASVFTYKSEHQSYPERTHGGMITALLDELMGRTLWVKQPEMYGVTTSITITFRKAVPFNQKLKARAVMTHEGSIGFSAKGYLYDMDNNLLAEGNCKFLKMSPEKAFGVDNHSDEFMRYLPEKDLEDIFFPEEN